ncbi:hypothetical protein [Sphingomonas bacterium]|uniref:hypothetical protein n=1 Tax=Sphingomonas bacterium TaxID=1895847 RepID=UPI0015776254|nr:hypothetical protein [Sphingomonas bacterium]
MSEVDEAIAAARLSWARITHADDLPFSRGTPRRPGALGRRLVRIGAAVVAILVGFTLVGMVMPVGIMGALLLMVLLVAAVGGLAVWPSDERAAPPPEKLRTVDLKALPAQTGRWLGAQRPALPAPARGIADRIGTRLEVLSPQLGAVDPGTEPALELRRLIGEQLPAFVNDYARVPEPLRSVERNGRSPDRELVDGLSLIEREIAAMTERLAQGDLDSLATRGRYLEMKYRGEQQGGAG